MGESFALFIVFVFSLLGIRTLTRYADRLQLIDVPNQRSAHKAPTPRGGGIAFTLAALIGLLLFHTDTWLDHLPLLTAILLVMSVGVLDDRHDVSPRFKFIVIALATLILYEAGLTIDAVGSYCGFDLHFGLLSIPFTFFALAGFSNAFNLIDGIDGLAGTLSLLILGSFLLLGWHNHDTLLFQLSTFFIVGVIAFLLFNWNPAAIFMGDSGSLTLGFLISTLSILALKYLPSVSILYLGAVPILDTLVAMIRRKRHGRSALSPDRCHIHHLLLHHTHSAPRTVGLIVALQMPFTFVGLLLPKGIDQTLPLLLFLAVVWILYRWVERLIAAEEIPCYPDEQ